MAPAAVSLVVAAVVFGGSLLAMYAARALPDSHLGADARDVIKLGIALIATLVALVLGLMIATAKGTYDAQSAAVRQLSADVLLLDRSLAEYGPEAQHPRNLLREAAGLMLQRLWPEDGSAPFSLAPGEAHAPMALFLREVTQLSPHNETQEFLKTQALRVTSDLAQVRFQMYVQATSELPLPFIVVAIWLIILFAGYGLIAARNPTVLVFLFAATLSVSGAVFLIQELATPFGGVRRTPARGDRPPRRMTHSRTSLSPQKNRQIIVGAPFMRVDYVFAFPLGSPIRKEVNRSILSYVETDEWRDLMRSYLGRDS